MKKIFGISLVAVLMSMPMMARAEVVAGDPGATASGAGTAGSAPKYALKEASGDDGKAATAAYVKGAYNAVIKGVNKTHDEVNTLNTGIETYSDAIGHLTDGKATKDGTVATIKSATTTESIATSSVWFSVMRPSSISATASGNVNLSVSAMSDWENDAEADNPIQATTTFSGLPVDGIRMTAPGANNTATLTKSDISGTVNVSQYVAATYWYSPLLDTNTDFYGYKSADGSNYDRATGLSNGEWKVIWEDYGTLRGTSMCSSDGSGMSLGGTINGTPNVSGTEADNKSCWCKMTGWTPNGGNETPAASLWVFISTKQSPSDCTRMCAVLCGSAVRANPNYRSAMFGSIQQ